MTKLTDTQWLLLQPHMPPQTRRGRNREHDREVLNSLPYRLKTGCRYQDIPRTPECAAPSTTFHWFKQWTEQDLFKRIWQALLGFMDHIGEIDLRRSNMDVRYERIAAHYLGSCVLTSIVMCLKRVRAQLRSREHACISEDAVWDEPERDWKGGMTYPRRAEPARRRQT